MKNLDAQSFRLKAAVVAVAMCFVSPVVWANPTGATVVNGTANFATNGNTLSITNSPGAILNWQQFNINQGQTTQFIQQSTQSSVLNRVLSNQPSQILGTLRSNGQVFLINQAGIVFGAGSVVDVNGLIASTLNISNADFLLNRLNFNGSNGTSVLNQGTITTPLGGRVYLIGNNVTNEGVITTLQGNVVLAAGNSVSLVDSMTPHISVTINAPAGGQVVNLGQVNTQGGSIDVYAALIQQQGGLRADSASVNAQGNIVLSATQAVNLAQGSVTSANGGAGGNVTVQSGAVGRTTVAGLVSATGSSVGGNVQILGNQVTLTDSARVDASGATGGGSVLIGGDFQGKNAAVQNATSTSIAQGASISADALVTGKGGKSVVWANDSTTFAGSISARGGAQGGDGGNVEVSGKRTLAFTGTVDTRAPKGQGGSLLLDPTSLCITDVAVAWAACPSVLSPVTIASNILTNTSWRVTTNNGDLVVIDPIYLSGTTGGSNAGSTFTLESIGGNVLTLGAAEAQTRKMGSGATGTSALGGGIFTYGANLVLNATGSAVAGTGGVHIANDIVTNGGNFTITAQGQASIAGDGGAPRVVATGGGTVNISATDFVLGWDQRTGQSLITPAKIETVWTGMTLPYVMGGGVNINTANGTPGSTGVLLESGSSINTGTGKINLSGYVFGVPSGTSGGAPIASSGQVLFSFDRIDTSRLSVNVGSLAFKPYTAGKNVLIGAASTDPRCLVDLCLFSNNMAVGSYYIWATRGIAVGSENNITVAGNVTFEGGDNQYALVALNDIILNGSLTITSPTTTLTNPMTGQPVPFPATNLALIAGNNVTNNVGVGALNLPAGHGWSLFAKDQTTTTLNGLTAGTVVNLAQDPLVFTPAAILSILTQPGRVGVNAANSAIANPALVQLLAGLTGAGGAISLGTRSGGNLALFWGSTYVAPVTPPLNCTLSPALCANTTPVVTPVAISLPPVVDCALNPSAPSCSPTVDCALNPSLCGNSTLNSAAKTAATTTSAVVQTTAVGDLTYSSSLGVVGGNVWVTYDDVRRSRQETRQADDEMYVASAQLEHARTSGEREVAHHELEVKSALVSVKLAEAKVTETEMETRAAEAEIKAAKSPAERVRAEIRQTVAVARRADAEVKKADADIEQAAVEVKNAKTPEAKATAEMKKMAAEARKEQAEVKKAEVEVVKAESEVKQLEDEVKTGDVSPMRVEMKRAEAAVKKADMEIKQAERELKSAKDPAARANAEVRVAAANAKKADTEAQKAVVEAKHAHEEATASDSPVALRVAETKKVEAEVKQAQAEVKKAEVEVKTAKDPLARAAAEEKVARAELKQAEADVKLAADKAKEGDAAKLAVDVKQAVVEEKKAEVAAKTEKEGSQKAQADVKLADARAKTAEADERQAVQEAKEAREAAKVAHSADDKYVAIKKAEASEARAVAKHSAFEAQKAESEAKRAEAEVKQAEVAVKEAKSPAQRAEAEKHLGEKQSEFARKRGDAEQKGQRAEALKGEADQKERAHDVDKNRRDEKVLAAFGGVDIAAMSPNRVQELMGARHDFLREKLGSALKLLEGNPKAADLKTCDSKSGDVCMRPLASIVNFAADIVARIRIPFMTPISAFLPQIQRKVAVVIGNNAYQDPDIPALNGAVRDADAVGKMLQEKMGYDVRMVHNGTRADIVRTLNQVADETGSKDSVVVYYAGHGYEMEDTKVGYWIPSDASTTSPENWISNADINKLLTNIPAKQMLIVSDSCFSGSLTNEQKVASALTSTETPTEILGKRSVLVMSSGGEEPVMDEGRDGHSIFAWHLMDKLNKLDTYEHGAEVFDAIKAGVAKDGIPQVPQYGASVSAGHSTGGDYLFEVRKY